MVKRVGEFMLAATVCPSETSRETITPSMGEVMVAFLRFFSAVCSLSKAVARLSLAWSRLYLSFCSS